MKWLDATLTNQFKSFVKTYQLSRPNLARHHLARHISSSQRVASRRQIRPRRKATWLPRNSSGMYAISGLGTVEEPLQDDSRVDKQQQHGSRRHSALPEDLDTVFPMARWTRAIYDDKKRRFPQTISHRGYKAAFPENTMRAFQGAVEAGTHALETDIHLTKDDVVVLSHDQDLKRCFGKEDKVVDCDWQFVSQQRTLREPHEPMPRLADLLEYLAQPAQQNIWLLLDIKVDNDAIKVMRLISETIKAVDSGPRKWNQRVVLGIWAVRYLPLCAQYLPGFPVSHIGFSPFYARQFMKVPNVSFNILQKVLPGPIGRRFIGNAKKSDRPVYVWTVNEVNMMKWSIQKELDGVITDDPRLFKEICDTWSDKEFKAQVSWSQWLYTCWLYILFIVFWIPIKRRFPEKVETFLQTSKGKDQSTQRIER